MYSIFSTKTSGVQRPPVEGEPPLKKLKTEGDVIIKKLVKKQMKTQKTLTEQLAEKKEFVSSTPFTSATGHIKGETRLQDFQTHLENFKEETRLKSKGLNDKDVEIYKEFNRMGPNFWAKTGKTSKEALEKRLSAIEHLLQQPDESPTPEATISRHERDYINSVKPQSVETRLLNFATVNSPKNPLRGPMDELPALEKQFMKDCEELKRSDVKKIRKNARSLAKRIENMQGRSAAPSTCPQPASLKRDTLWDVQEPFKEPAKQVETTTKNYGCKPQELYTIKDGTITKLIADKTVTTIKTGGKLTTNEIKNIAKFSNYEAGQPSNVLFLKNISKCVSEAFLSQFLLRQQLGATSIRVMGGKMKGQAFLEFSDATQTTKALNALNGVLVNERPIVAQFGKKNPNCTTNKSLKSYICRALLPAKETPD